MKLPDSIFIVPEKLPRHLLKKYKFELFHRVALACDFPEKHLCHGNVATIRDRHPAPDDGEPAYSFEVFNAIGD